MNGMNYEEQRETIRAVLSELTGIPTTKIKFDESGRHADLSWRVPAGSGFTAQEIKKMLFPEAQE